MFAAFLLNIEANHLDSVHYHYSVGKFAYVKGLFCQNILLAKW